MGLNDELEKARYAIRVISGTELGDVDAAVEHIEHLVKRVQDHGVTFATLLGLADRTLEWSGGSARSRGYRRAMIDVKAILDKHGAPPGEPVHFGETAT